MQKPTIPRRFTSAVYHPPLPPVNASRASSRFIGNGYRGGGSEPHEQTIAVYKPASTAVNTPSLVFPGFPSDSLAPAPASPYHRWCGDNAMDQEYRRMDLVLTVTLLLLLFLSVLLIANLIGAINVYG